VDNDDLLLAAFNGQPGGTVMTVKDAQKKGMPVLIFNPL
jgi:hypothetical protein